MNKSPKSWLDALIDISMGNRGLTILMLFLLLTWGVLVAPFDWNLPGISRSPVPVDAIPDIGENQQIVFTEWPGRSPQDVEDQITYPLTVALLGTPEVKTVRSFSMFGFSTIYVIFKDDIDFYWSRSRLLEKLSALPSGILPEAVKPVLGPDATALGQVFWYTLEGRDQDGDVTGGWDLNEIRSVQDYFVRYALSTVPGVAEVASVGGYVKEYQIDVDPLELRHYNISLLDVFKAVQSTNNEIGARTLEVNRAEYVIRALGFIRDVEDIQSTVLRVIDNTPVTLADVAEVSLGPANRRGALDKRGAEVVGGVVTTRYGENPLDVINALKLKITEITPGLPSKVLDDGSISRLSIVPFYDRSGLIYETLGTLNHALRDEILITIIVILVMLFHIRASLIISLVMPMAVLISFVGMKLFGVDANIVALSGIAIAIGTIVDMGIVMTENIIKQIKVDDGRRLRIKTIRKAAKEVSPAILTAVSTTVISFLPVFVMEGAEGKLFKPLAYTKTFALVASLSLAILVVPVLASFFFRREKLPRLARLGLLLLLLMGGLFATLQGFPMAGVAVISLSLLQLFRSRLKRFPQINVTKHSYWILVLVGIVILAHYWVPLGYEYGAFLNLSFTGAIVGLILAGIGFFTARYPQILMWMLRHRKTALSMPLVIVLFGISAWLGIDKTTPWLPTALKKTPIFQKFNHLLPGLGKEFMPPLDEGAFLYMPTTMSHAGIEESLDVLSTLDKAIYSIPEVEEVVGKIGRADTPLDPAPLSMIESMITYLPEYKQDAAGNIKHFKVNKTGEFIHTTSGDLVEDPGGEPFRQWRPHIRNNQDIWDEIVAVAQIPGTTSAPKLQPIAARVVMLQSGMRAPMGLRIRGANIESMESFGLELEQQLKLIPGIKANAVFADRIVGKPYIEIDIDRENIARYGLSIRNVHDVIAVAVGGKQVTNTFEGRERYPVRVRYMRDYREDVESLSSVLVPTPTGAQIPLGQLATIRFTKGPQVIKSEDTFLLSYVLFDRESDLPEVDAVERVQSVLIELIDKGELVVPPGIGYDFTGSYENQIRATQRLRLVLPLALILIFTILYIQFKRVSTTLMVFSGVFVAWSGGFILLWLYGQNWFLHFSLGSFDLQDIFQIGPMNMSVAVWVGFLALFGIATDDGVLISTYLDQHFKRSKPRTLKEIRAAAVAAGSRRIRPAMITTATTILALLPILTSSGRGSDVMVPMAIPSFGGMFFVTLNTLVVPVLYAWVAERRLLREQHG